MSKAHVAGYSCTVKTITSESNRDASAVALSAAFCACDEPSTGSKIRSNIRLHLLRS
jgi:hypothetical protein